jgi:hypothetical protein
MGGRARPGRRTGRTNGGARRARQAVAVQGAHGMWECDRGPKKEVRRHAGRRARDGGQVGPRARGRAGGGGGGGGVRALVVAGGRSNRRAARCTGRASHKGICRCAFESQAHGGDERHDAARVGARGLKGKGSLRRGCGGCCGRRWQQRQSGVPAAAGLAAIGRHARCRGRGAAAAAVAGACCARRRAGARGRASPGCDRACGGPRRQQTPRRARRSQRRQRPRRNRHPPAAAHSLSAAPLLSREARLMGRSSSDAPAP